MKKTLHLLFIFLSFNYLSELNAQCGAQASADATIGCGSSYTVTATTNSVVYSVVPSACSPVAIAGTNAFPTTCDDCVTGQIPLGFNFNFYGNTYNSVVISSNGLVGFGAFTFTGFTPFTIPAGGLPNNYIAGFMCDIDIRFGGTITYQMIGTAPNRQFVVSYNNVVPYNGGTSAGTGTASFQIIIHENGSFRVVISQLSANWNSSTSGALATSGAENIDGTLAFPVPGRNNTDWPGINSGAQDCHIFNPVPCIFTNWTVGGTVVSTSANYNISPTTTTTYNANWNCGGTPCTRPVVITVGQRTLSLGTPTPNTGCGTPNGIIPLNFANVPDGNYTLTYSFNGTPTTRVISINSGFAQLTGLNTGNYTAFSIPSIAGCSPTTAAGPVTITAPNLPTATGVTICPGGSGSLTSFFACPPTGTTIARGATFNSGTLSATDPQWNRNTSGTTCNGTGGTGYYYDVFSFTVSTAGSYTFNGCFPNIDAHASLYQNAFNGTNPCGTPANFIMADDDGNGVNCALDPRLTANLVPGITYFIVSTTFGTGTTDSYSWTFDGPNGSTITTGGGPAGTLQWYTAAAGGSPIGTGSSFNPVGVTGSGLSNTNTAGTTTYYLACSGSPTCRTAVNYVINAAPTAAVAGTNTICSGQSTTLTASGGSTYLWSTGATTATLSVSPATNTTYNVTVTSAAGCTATASRTVTVNQAHTITGAGNRTVCQNALVGITMTLGGGATGANVTGLPAGVVASVSGTTLSISGNPSVSGTFNYNVSTTGNTCTPATTGGTITVTALNTIQAGTNQTVCRLSPIVTMNLNTTGATGTSYSGLPPGLAASWAGNVVTISGSPNTAGTFNYTISTTGGCTPATTSGTIVVNALPSASVTGTNSICAGRSTTLTASGGGTYSWSTGAGTTAINVTPAANTTYTVTVTNASGCTATTSSTVTVNPLPTASISGSTTVCSSASTTLTASGGSSYSWSTGVGTAAINVSPAANTTYTVTVTSASGCTATANASVTVNQASTAPSLNAPGTICPNTTVLMTASGGTSGTGSQVGWYTGPNGTGTFLGFGNSFNWTPTATSTIYARREGVCNNSSDATSTVTVRNYVYAANGTSTSTYCTDNAGWHHFYTGNNIILSLQGNLASAGTVTVTIRDNGAYYLDPGNTALCASGWTPGEAQFEMERNWNVQHTGSLSGTYNVRYYFEPAERTAVINAANNWMTTYAACGYNYKYNPANNGWFWFKNQGSAYTAPDYDDDPTFLMLTSSGTGTTPNGINWATMSGVTNFSGGTGGIILVPSTLLPVEWLYFTGNTVDRINKLQWATASEENTREFEVQRSRDGINFEVIGTVQAAGNSSVQNNYLFDDVNPYSGLNYYRLRLINNDNSTEFSETIVLEINETDFNSAVYPNPATDEIIYSFSSQISEDIRIVLIDALGRVLRERTIRSNVGINNLKTDLRDLVPAAYNLRITHLQSGKEFSKKIIKK